ncbi:MAG TPA: tetratricopeptide repeat protein [Candidatus Polarisedimenticolia bacterium]|jgi:tetratricopeptide (TPR) repeat protein
MPVSTGRFRTRAAPALFLVLVSAALYANTLMNGFVGDDQFQVLRNPWIQDVRHLPEIFSRDVWSFVEPGGRSIYYRPMMHVIYMITFHLTGLMPWGFHLVNLLLHAACTVMVFGLGSRLASAREDSGPASRTGLATSGAAPAAPFAAALLFAAHPVHTEAVAWVASVPDLSVCFFYLAAVYGHARAARPLDRPNLLCTASFFLALLCKETALTLPLALGAWDIARGTGRRAPREHLGIYAPYMLAGALYLWLRYRALSGVVTEVGDAHGLGAVGLILNALALFSRYLGMTLLPLELNSWHAFPPVLSPLDARSHAAIAVVAGFCTLLGLAFVKDRGAFFALALGALPLLPVLDIRLLAGKPFAERYLYLPSAGLIIAAVWCLYRMCRHREWVVWLALIPILSLCATATVRRNSTWRDPIALYSDATRKSPDAAPPRYFLAQALHEAGRLDEAIDHYRVLVASEPRDPSYRSSLGDALLLKGRLDEAIEQLNVALVLDPNSTVACNDLGTALQRQGRPREAVEAYRRALAIDPAYAEAHYNLGAILAATGQMAEAMAHMEEAVRLKPADAHYRNVLGIEYAKRGRMRAAIEQFEAATRLAPDEPDFRRNLDQARREAAR